jgi:hypothetical protein
MAVSSSLNPNIVTSKLSKSPKRKKSMGRLAKLKAYGAKAAGYSKKSSRGSKMSDTYSTSMKYENPPQKTDGGIMLRRSLNANHMMK